MRRSFCGIRKRAALAAFCAVLLPAGMVHAVTGTITVVADFVTSLSLSGTDMAFGKVAFDATPSGSTVQIGMNSTATYTSGFTNEGGTIASAVATILTGSNGSVVEVRCDSGAAASVRLTRTGGGTIDITNVRVAAETGSLPGPGGGSACNGTGGAAATTMTLAGVNGAGGGATDQFYFGGTLDGSTAAAFVAGSYSTANAGGAVLDVTILYQ